MKKWMLAALLAFAMAMCLLPAVALADEQITVTVSGTTSLQEAVTQVISSSGSLDSVTDLKVVTTDGKVLTEDDFQFLSGVEVTATDDGRYSSTYAGTDDSMSSITYLKNLEVLDLSEATCKDNAIPPRAFQKNSKIKKIILPNNLERTYLHAFSMMKNLEYLGTLEDNLTFPASMKIMGEGMVYECSNLKGELTLPSSLEAIGSSCFYQSGISGAVAIPAGVNINVNTDVNNGQYDPSASIFNGTDITELVFAEGITKISDSFAANCDQLTSVTIPSTVTEIGSYAFSGTALAQLPQMDGVTKIGDHAFSGIKTFTGDITLAGSVEVAERAFQQIKTTGDVSVCPNVSLSSHAFHQAEIGGNVSVANSTVPDHAFYSATIGGSIVLEEGVQTVGEHAFASVKDDSTNGGITLTLPSTLTVLQDFAFDNAALSGSLELPGGLTEIGEYAFRNHGFTGNLTIPGSVETVGKSAFEQSTVNDSTTSYPGFNGTLTIENGRNDDFRHCF